MTPDYFAKAGAALYGPRWRSSLAEALGIDRRTVHRWVTGKYPVPAGQAELIRHELTRRRAEIDKLLE